MNKFYVDGITGKALVIGIILSALNIILFKSIPLVGGLIIILALVRFFIVKPESRQRQAYYFNMVTGGLRGKIKKSFSKDGLSNMYKGLTHEIVKCPYCKQKLRVPKKKGNITIVCSKCRHTFKTRT